MQRDIVKLETKVIDELLEHNRLRALHGSDPLILDGKLSKSAEKWAKHLAVVGKISHSGKHAENVFSVVLVMIMLASK